MERAGGQAQGRGVDQCSQPAQRATGPAEEDDGSYTAGTDETTGGKTWEVKPKGSKTSENLDTPLEIGGVARLNDNRMNLFHQKPIAIFLYGQSLKQNSYTQPNIT